MKTCGLDAEVKLQADSLLVNPYQAQVNFFSQGKVRSVSMVGGLGGRVEGTQSEGGINAPMNGQVVKVPVKIGDHIECGEVVLVLETMKMENEVTAPISGTRTGLQVSVGQTVSPGQPMFQVEAIE